MDAAVTSVAMAALVADGLFAGLSLDKVIVQLPARRQIGVTAYAAYARYPDRGDKWTDEDVPIDCYPMAAGNAAAEASALRFSHAGRTGVVLRFGWFYGPGAKHSEQMVAQARHHVGMMIGPSGSYVSVIHLADASSAVRAALQAPAGTFNIVDDEPLTKRQFVDALAEATRTSLWVRTPGHAARLLGDRLTSLTRSLRVSNRRLREVTGWAPRYPSAREGWPATLAALC